ncbi:hypothetical protein KKE48_04710 [Patescibacteria group bacterium]|nr:hypothetical protein [Patescibacteria group bacterium]
MPTLLKKISLVFILIFSLFVFRFLSPSLATASYLDLQGQNPSETFKQALESNSMNYSQFSLNSVDQIIMGLTKKMVNYPALEGETTDTSLLNTTGKAIGFLYNNQPSFIEYLAYEGQRLNLIKPAFAASGGGWDWLNPTLPIWTISRNVSYLFFVVIFVAVGFMIMFRSKLNPQTVINIQLALPRIVVGLIMVTFSYAISGLLVDVVFLGHGLLRNIVVVESGIKCHTDPDWWPGKVFGDPNTIWEQGYDKDTNTCDMSMLTPSAWPFNIMGRFGSEKDGSGIVDLALSGIGEIFLGKFTEKLTGLFRLIIAFSVISATFKIFFSLLTKYVMIIILVITMPFSFLGSALSAQSSPIKPLKALLANTISFPITSLLLVLAYYFSSAASGTKDLAPLYMGAFSTTRGDNITAGLVAIGILMSIPTILAAVDKAFEAQPIAQAATEQLAGGFRKIPIIGGLMG